MMVLTLSLSILASALVLASSATGSVSNPISTTTATCSDSDQTCSNDAANNDQLSNNQTTTAASSTTSARKTNYTHWLFDRRIQNTDEECEFWADEGECDLNPGYMLMGCTKACKRVNDQIQIKASSSKDQCQLFLAESSIPNSGLGVYTSVPILPLSNLYYPDIVVNVVDYDHHQNLRRQYEREVSLKDIEEQEDAHLACSDWAIAGECEADLDYMLTSCKIACTLHSKGLLKKDDEKQPSWLPRTSYVWDATNTRSIYETDGKVESLVPGLGMLGNSHLALSNIAIGQPFIDGAGLHRRNDPGTGAFTNFHGLSFTARKEIVGGMELFSDYGEGWFTAREHTFGPVPFDRDFRNADNIIKQYNNLIYEKDDTFAQDLLTFVRDDLISRKHLQMALPSKVEKVKKALEKGTAIVSLPNVIRSTEWLMENGLCLDNIEARVSTIQQAGRGAFATRRVEKNDIIAPAPMVHIQRSDLHMYKKITDDNDGDGDGGSNSRIAHVSEQMLLNYVYGHPESSLLLFPYSPVTNFINHNSDKTKINAKIQWSTIPNHREEWLDMSPKEVLLQTTTGLIMEFVAIRDIDEGEEIFIDYGDRWQEAWDEHVKTWQPLDGAEHYVSAEELNLKEEDYLKTEVEQKENPYPSNVATICFVPGDLLEGYKEKNPAFWYEQSFLWYRSIKDSRECTISNRSLSHDTGEYVYEANVKIAKDKYLIVKSIARHAIEFVNKPHTSDQHIMNAFRYELEIPENVFPDRWKDLRDSSS